jgi:hypothetical protein
VSSHKGVREKEGEWEWEDRGQNPRGIAGAGPVACKSSNTL